MSNQLTEPMKSQICSILVIGGTHMMAAEYVGCTVLAIAQESRSDPDFAERLAHAEATCETLHLKNIRAAAEDPKQWRASAWLLERVFPDRYVRRKPNTITCDQASLLIQQITEILLDEVPDEFCRNRIRARLHSVISSTSAVFPGRGLPDAS